MKKTLKDKNYEQCLTSLEEIVEHLEKGDLPLEESIKKFQEGTLLANMCTEKLKVAEEKIKKLIEKDDGQIEQVDFNFENEAKKKN
ncbi:MAG: exodeoxyribonuclease VII small subunit [Armatimonadota bacterium]